MEKEIDGDDDYFPSNFYSNEIINLAHDQVDKAISTALNYLVNVFSSPSISHTTIASSSSSTSSILLKPSVSTPNRAIHLNGSIRCRSSSRNDRRDKKNPFHHTIPRCSLPATNNDLVYFQSYLLTCQQANQPRRRSSHHFNSNNPNRSFDVQYSYSLNKPWSNKIDKQRHNFICISNFVNEFVQHSIRTALLRIDYQCITQNKQLAYENETSYVLFDCSQANTTNGNTQIINSYVDQLVHLTIQESIHDISVSNNNIIEHLSNRLTQDAINDALLIMMDNESHSKSLLTEDEKHSRRAKKHLIAPAKIINNENIESQPSLFQQIRHRSTSAFRSITNNNHRRETVDSIVNNIAQKIYIDSFDELKRIFSRNIQQ